MDSMKKPRTVLLYSGGMDSFLAYHLIQPDVLLYAALGHRYQKRELEAIKSSGLPVVVDDRFRLGDLELPNAIIPLRNLYLLALATHYGRAVYLGALAGEVNPDKSELFAQALTDVLNIAYGKSYWSEGERVSIEYPLGHLTKVEAVRMYLERGYDPRALVEKTVSCYAGREKPCGICSACLKRYIALKLNALSEVYETNPHSSPYLHSMVERWPTFDQKRREETLLAFPELREQTKDIV